jgi:fructosamine-3-kinase
VNALHTQIAAVVNSAVTDDRPLAGGCVADVRLVTLADGRQLVAKSGTGLLLEARMLRYLAEHSAVPVPRVHHAAADLLLMDYIPAGDAINDRAQTHAAELLAALHGITAPTFGLEFDTVIGGLPQPNARHRSWRTFFRERRLMHMAEEANAAERLPTPLLTRLVRLADHLEKWIDDDDTEPALIHGDLWGGNILVRNGRIVGLVDPAISFSNPEIELAFATLFGTFGKAFFARYDAIKPIEPGFFEARRDLYNLYPLLVHVRLFGGSYVADVERIVKRFGY